MVWMSYFFFLYDTVPAVPVSSVSPERPGNGLCDLYDGPRAAAERSAAASDSPGRRAAAASWSTVEYQSYKLVSTFLQDGDLRQPGYPERRLISNKTWCSPFGAENPICWRRTEKEHQTFLCCNVRLFWGFFLLFHAHFSNLNSSLMSSAFPSSVHMWVFTRAHHFKDKSLNGREWVQMAHPFWQS